MIELQPVLHGPTLTLRPLQPDDFEALYAAASDPLIWEQHPEPTRCQRDVFRTFFDKGIESKGAFLVTERETGKVLGSSRYYDWNPEKREVAIGYTFLVRACWGGVTNGEMKQLMLDHIYRWTDTVWFHIGHNNWRSRKALEKIGGVLSHYEFQDVGGMPHQYAYYTLTRRT
jgi:RimJ/RimL family protein N-acetyltransferase